MEHYGCQALGQEPQETLQDLVATPKRVAWPGPPARLSSHCCDPDGRQLRALASVFMLHAPRLGVIACFDMTVHFLF